MLVKLNYFKPSGKWYSEAEYFTGEKDLWMIWNEVEYLWGIGKLPGLVDGANEFLILIDVPDHPHNNPHMIIKAIKEEYPKCEVHGCHEPADYEGWWRALDFTGMETGLIQRRQVCEGHKTLLIGGK